MKKLKESDFPLDVPEAVVKAFEQIHNHKMAIQELMEAIYSLSRNKGENPWDKIREEMPDVAEFDRTHSDSLSYDHEAQQITLRKKGILK